MIIIRKFETNDMFSIIKLASDTLSEKYNPSLFNYFYETYPDGFIIAEKNHKIIGFIVGLPIDNNAKILMLSVSSKERRQNIASNLLNNFITEITKEDIKNIELEVREDNKKAIKFYKKHGFKVTNKIQNFYQNKEDALTMKKKIKL